MPDNLKPLLYWVKEREAIRMARLAHRGPAYTTDPILATFRFCNVRRRDDRVSTWLRSNVLTQADTLRDEIDLQNFLLFAAWCRWVNWPPTIQAVLAADLFPARKLNWAKIGKVIDRIYASGSKAWTGAYMIRASKEKGRKKGGFISQEVVGKHLKKAIPGIADLLVTGDATFRNVHAALCEVPNFGSFMAGQVAGDLTYTRLLANAPDLTTWAPMGPGSVRGFNRIMGNPGKLSKRPPEELWTSKLIKWRAAIVKRMGEGYEDVTALDVQNCLCEVDKYLRFQNGEGRPRARYTPHTY